MVMNVRNRFWSQRLAKETVFELPAEAGCNAVRAAEMAARGGRDLVDEIEHEMRAAATAGRAGAAQSSGRYLALLLIAGSRALHQQRQ